MARQKSNVTHTQAGDGQGQDPAALTESELEKVVGGQTAIEHLESMGGEDALTNAMGDPNPD